ncbi:MAG: peptidoglycan editing factor PgeF [Nitrospirota bacterium]
MGEPVVVPPLFRGQHVQGFFTTKALNGDPKALAGFLNIDERDIYLPIQKHTDKIVIVDHDMEAKIADAVITGRKGIFIGVRVADCVPILLYDRKKRISGAVHAGWRGTAEEILKKTIALMMSRFYSSPEDILMAVGPSIKWCCYEVGHEVIEAVVKVNGEGAYYKTKGEKYCIDLPSANLQQALSLGIPAANIWISDECTFCKPDRFYSYRFAKGSTGRQGGFIGIV